jgi:hypothetical protein
MWSPRTLSQCWQATLSNTPPHFLFPILHNFIWLKYATNNGKLGLKKLQHAWKSLSPMSTGRNTHTILSVFWGGICHMECFAWGNPPPSPYGFPPAHDGVTAAHGHRSLEGIVLWIEFPVGEGKRLEWGKAGFQGSWFLLLCLFSRFEMCSVQSAGDYQNHAGFIWTVTQVMGDSHALSIILDLLAARRISGITGSCLSSCCVGHEGCQVKLCPQSLLLAIHSSILPSP